MKQIITPAYAFDPAARTLDFSAVAGFSLGSLIAVINNTTNSFVYAKGLAGYGVSGVVGGVLTVATDTTAMHAGDSLTIFYDVPAATTVTANLGALNGAATDASLATLHADLGSDGTGAAPLPGGSTGVRGWLRAIAEKLSGSVAVTGTFWQATQPVSAATLPLPSGAATSAAQPALHGDGGALAHVTNLPATQPVSAAALPLPAGAATDATAQSILTAIQAQRAETLWTDDSGAYFVRVDSRGTITWTDPSGNATSAPGTGARPAAGTSAIVEGSRYQAIAAGTGYAINDYLSHVVTADPSSGTVIGHFWINVSTETKLASAPAAASITPISPLPAGAAKDATVQSVVTALGSISGTVTANLGTLNGAATAANQVALRTAPGTSASQAGAVQGVTGGVPIPVTWSGQSVTANIGTTNGLALDSSLQSIKTTLGSPFQAGGNIGNTSFGISGTLPAFAATPTFRVDQTTPGTTNKVSIGSDGTVAALQSGAWSVSATQSGVWTVAQGAAGATPWKVDGSAVTQPISAAALPLPSGAATDASVLQVKATLGSPFQAGGSIGNASFGISGTLPAFAAIPAFKIDQTTPGGTNRVSIGNDGTVAVGNFPATQAVVSAAFAPTGQATLTAGTTSSNVALGSAGPTVVVTNNGAATAFVNFGGSAVTATTSNYPVSAGQSFAYSAGTNTYIAAITAAGSAPLSITSGTGMPVIANAGGSGGGGSGGNVTVVGPLGAALGASAAVGVVQQDAQTITLSAAAAAPLSNATYTTGAIPTAGYASANVQFTAFGSGNNVVFEESNDGATWYSTAQVFTSSNAGNSSFVSGTIIPSAATAYRVVLSAIYFRIRVSAYSSGTVTAVLALKVTNLQSLSTYVSSGNVTLNGGNFSNVGALGASTSSGGISGFSRIPSCAASTNLTQAKSSVGRLYRVTGYNNVASPRRIKFYNALSANVTVGTTAVYFSRVLPPGAFSFDMGDIGWYFSTAISYALVQGAADNDNTAVAAGDITDLSIEFV